MTATILVLVSALCAISVQEQPRTLVGEPLHSGGFGALELKWGRLTGEDALFVGGRGGWIINHSFVLGGGGYGLVSQDIRVIPAGGSPRDCRLEMGYGGLELEYVYRSLDVVHGSVLLLLGAGSAGYRDRGWDRTIASDAFFVMEPGLTVELNVIRSFRIALGGSYRFVTGFDLPDLPTVHNKDLDGLTGSLAFKFGSF